MSESREDLNKTTESAKGSETSETDSAAVTTDRRETVLSYLRVLQPSVHWPHDVWIEVLEGHRFRFSEEYLSYEWYREKLVKRLQECPPDRVTKPFNSHRSYSLIANFLNGRALFTVHNALRALSYLRQFFDTLPKLSSLEKDDLEKRTLRLGRPTNEHPISVGPTVMTAYILQGGGKVSYETTFTDLCHQFLFLLQSRQQQREYIFRMIRRSSLRPMELFAVLQDKGVEPGSYLDGRRLERVPEETLEPELTVFRAALEHSIDLSSSPFPELEYQRLSEGKEFLDPELRKKCSPEIPERDGIDLNYSFNPRLPVNFYSRSQLQYFARREGLNPDLEEIELYTLLCRSMQEPSFYRGYDLTELTTWETPIYRFYVPDLPQKEVLSYGIWNQDCQPITYDELAEYLHHEQRQKVPFEDPPGGPWFSHRNFQKLLSLVSPDTNLYHILLSLQEDLSKRDEKLNILQKYREDEDVMSFVQELLSFSMHLRGWDGESEYPLEKASDLDHEESERYILSSYRRLCEKGDQCPFDVWSLPLLLYSHREFHNTNNPESGRDIRERMGIILDYQNQDNVNACLRESSNWFASSAWVYYRTLGKEPPFHIERMRHLG